MIIVRQKLGNAPYNCVLQPSPGGKIRIGDSVKCVDPVTGKTVTGTCIDFWTFLWAELPDWFCQDTYGTDAYSLYKRLQQIPKYKDADYLRFCKLKLDE